ncbi:MAG: sigma-70 family RNA polymerase sigma factor [Myxococcota bacterium]
MSWGLDVSSDTIERAKAGDADALDAIAMMMMQPVYNVAVRFLYEPIEAEDAAQEAVLRVLKGLPTFRGDSSFSTWAYRVVVRSLSNVRRGRRESLSIEDGIRALDEGLASEMLGPEDAVLVEEVKLSCTTALLVCLPRSQRMAYVLGEIMGFSGPEAASILEIAPTAFRQRLAVARKTVREFFRARCGLVDEGLPCRCERQVAYCRRVGFIDPSDLRFANRGPEHRSASKRLDQAFDEASIYRAHPNYEPTRALGSAIRARLAEVLDVQGEA